MSDPIQGSALLVVGGAGFVGSNLAHALLARNPRSLTIVDNFLSSERVNIPSDLRVNLIEGSIAEDAILMRIPEQIDYVWHLACYHGNQSSIVDPIADHDNNSFTSLKLFQYLSTRKDIEKVVYSAAGCAVAEKTYDSPTATPEDAPVSLFHDSPYSISKLIGEMYGNYYFRQKGLPFVKARFQNVYGPREILGAGEWRGTSATIWRNVIPTFIWKALNGDELVLDNGGNVSRDFIFVEDVCRGLIACALNGSPGEAYNIASGVETSIRSLAERIIEITDSGATVRLGPPREWDNSGRRFGSTLKAERDIGFRSETGLDEGLRKTVDWTVLNSETVSSCIRKHLRNLESIENR